MELPKLGTQNAEAAELRNRKGSFQLQGSLTTRAVYMLHLILPRFQPSRYKPLRGEVRPSHYTEDGSTLLIRGIASTRSFVGTSFGGYALLGQNTGSFKKFRFLL